MNKSTKIKDDQGQETLALTVFAKSIEYLAKNLFESVQKREAKPQKSDTMWVITVPAIWDADAKEFMKEAADMVFKLKFNTCR